MAQVAFAVTTRSRLRGFRHFPLMLASSLWIRRQMAGTPGLTRFASIIAGPREFWTVSVWESRDRMLAFMRSGAHETIMWQSGRWLKSFWLTRWRPTGPELGEWEGRRLTADEDEHSNTGATTDEQRAILQAALDAIPHLKASTDDSGKATYDSSILARRQRKMLAGGGALMVRLEAPTWGRLPAAWWDIYRWRRLFEHHPGVLRSVAGVSGIRDCYALALLRDEQACTALFNSKFCQRMHDRWGAACWVMRWEPANEFGHWDGMRLRRERLGAAIPVPEAAAKAAGMARAAGSIRGLASG